jgi:hypothetical protein
LFRHNEILIRKDCVHVRHIKTSIRHVNTGFEHDNMTLWNNKTVFSQVSTTFWQDIIYIWPNKSSLRQVSIKCWQVNTSIIHNNMFLGINKAKYNNVRPLWRSIILGSSNLLFKMKYVKSPLYSLRNLHDETIEHIFWECIHKLCIDKLNMPNLNKETNKCFLV